MSWHDSPCLLHGAVTGLVRDDVSAVVAVGDGAEVEAGSADLGSEDDPACIVRPQSEVIRAMPWCDSPWSLVRGD